MIFMIEVQMSDDIRKFETKFIGNFTMRQTISILIGALVGLPLGFFLPMTAMNRWTVAAFVAIPIGMCGWLKIDGMHLEVFFMRFIYQNFMSPKKRRANTRNTYKVCYQQIQKQNEQKKLAQMSKKERKHYQNKTIKYGKNTVFK